MSQQAGMMKALTLAAALPQSLLMVTSPLWVIQVGHAQPLMDYTTPSEGPQACVPCQMFHLHHSANLYKLSA